MSRLVPLISVALALFCLGGCGGKIAKTGWARVTGVFPDGHMWLQYEDGDTEFKRLPKDASPADVRTAARNMLKPARYVETHKGSTLTFPDGKTINYHDEVYDGGAKKNRECRPNR